MSARRRGEQGQTAVLIVGLLVVVTMLVAVVVDASAAYLRRQALSSLADGAALAAADGLEGERVYLGGLGERAHIDPADAERRVAAHLDAVGAAGRYPGLRWRVQARADRVVVRLVAPLDLPFGVPGVGDAPLIAATGAAVAAVG